LNVSVIPDVMKHDPCRDTVLDLMLLV